MIKGKEDLTLFNEAANAWTPGRKSSLVIRVAKTASWDWFGGGGGGGVWGGWFVGHCCFCLKINAFDWLSGFGFLDFKENHQQLLIRFHSSVTICEPKIKRMIYDLSILIWLIKIKRMLKQQQ